jgi:hypothetical protein
MEHLPASPGLGTPAVASADGTPVSGPRAACCGTPAAPRKLDLTGMAAPGDLQATRLEEFTIDGICGVY